MEIHYCRKGHAAIPTPTKRCRICKKEWRKANPDKCKQPYKYNKAKALRRINLRRNWLRLGDVTKNQLIEIYNKTNGKCFYCNKMITYARFWPSEPRGFDHVVPRSKGGKHTASNMVLCCFECNCLKSDKTNFRHADSCDAKKSEESNPQSFVLVSGST